MNFVIISIFSVALSSNLQKHIFKSVLYLHCYAVSKFLRVQKP